MTVHRDKRNGRWRYAFMHNGIRYSGSAPASNNTKSAAAAAEKEHESRLSKGITIRKAVTVAELVRRFLEYQASEQKPLTVETQTVHLEQHVVPRIGRLRIDPRWTDECALSAVMCCDGAAGVLRECKQTPNATPPRRTEP